LKCLLKKKGNGKHRKCIVGASAGDYFAAAQFYYQSNGDINKARTYIDKALEMSAENHFIFAEIIDFEARRQELLKSKALSIVHLLKPQNAFSLCVIVIDVCHLS
jgi:hypothetical protein